MLKFDRCTGFLRHLSRVTCEKRQKSHAENDTDVITIKTAKLIRFQKDWLKFTKEIMECLYKYYNNLMLKNVVYNETKVILIFEFPQDLFYILPTLFKDVYAWILPARF